jgi:predicted phosphodiesterase
MRYAILSDAHGNLEALQVVLDYLGGQTIDQFVFLGDAVGYGANPNEVCDRLRPLADVAVLGNHDAAVCGRMEYSDYYDAARQALDWCTSELSEENLAWLNQLPFKVRREYIDFCHGAPLVPESFDYLFAAEQLHELIGSYDEFAPVTFIGHSHLTISFRLERDRVTPILLPEIVCEPEAKYIVTVGSVGQPRDRDPRSSCGIFDSETRVFTFVRLDYDKETTRTKIINAGLAPVFGERLLVGM